MLFCQTQPSIPRQKYSDKKRENIVIHPKPQHFIARQGNMHKCQVNCIPKKVNTFGITSVIRNNVLHTFCLYLYFFFPCESK
ncbi:hypothetical protein FKM82_023358 [Ascaphus truei]